MVLDSLNVLDNAEAGLLPLVAEGEGLLFQLVLQNFIGAGAENIPENLLPRFSPVNLWARPL